jgi:shikimate kinase
MEEDEHRPRIVVVGPCAAGKTTLVVRLQRKRYNIRSCAQEHSHVSRLWKRYCRADVLVYLDADLDTISRRQNRSDWTQARLDEQHRRLADARLHCDFYLRTDEWTRGQVAARVEGFLREHGLIPAREGQDGD